MSPVLRERAFMFMQEEIDELREEHRMKYNFWRGTAAAAAGLTIVSVVYAWPLVANYVLVSLAVAGYFAAQQYRVLGKI